MVARFQQNVSHMKNFPKENPGIGEGKQCKYLKVVVIKIILYITDTLSLLTVYLCLK